MNHRPTSGTAYHELLEDARRRHLLQVLDEVQTPVDLEELVGRVLSREQDRPRSEIDDEQLSRCRIELYHIHLPKLAEAGLVSFDTDKKTVTLQQSVSPLVTVEQ